MVQGLLRLGTGIGVVVAGVTCLFFAATTQAQEAQTGSLSRGFLLSDPGAELIEGTLVSTTTDDASKVEAASTDSASRLIGVLSKNAVVSVSEGDETAQAQVVLNGVTEALVSNINGDIQSGDKITASPLAGIGMLTTNDSQIIGIAQADFPATNTQTITVQDKQGIKREVRVGRIPLQVDISYFVAPTNQYVPPFLQQIADNVAGRPVSFMRIILGCLLLLLAFSSIFVLIYTSVRSGIISLGRNPLAAKAIQRSLIGVIVIVLLISGLSLMGVYLILTV